MKQFFQSMTSHKFTQTAITLLCAPKFSTKCDNCGVQFVSCLTFSDSYQDARSCEVHPFDANASTETRDVFFRGRSGH